MLALYWNIHFEAISLAMSIKTVILCFNINLRNTTHQLIKEGAGFTLVQSVWFTFPAFGGCLASGLWILYGLGQAVVPVWYRLLPSVIDIFTYRPMIDSHGSDVFNWGKLITALIVLVELLLQQYSSVSIVMSCTCFKFTDF